MTEERQIKIAVIGATAAVELVEPAAPEREGQDHAGRVIVGVLNISLFQEGKTQTEARFDIVRVFAKQVAKDLFGFLEVTFA